MLRPASVSYWDLVGVPLPPSLQLMPWVTFRRTGPLHRDAAHDQAQSSGNPREEIPWSLELTPVWLPAQAGEVSQPVDSKCMSCGAA